MPKPSGIVAAILLVMAPAFAGAAPGPGAAWKADLRSLAGRRTAWLLVAGGAAALAAERVEDPDAQASFLGGRAFDGASDLGNVYGNGAVLAGGALGLLAVGTFADRPNLARAGGEAARALVWSAAAVWVLKPAVNRRRPDGGSRSFPSGHTATAFSVAPVVAARFGWEAGVGAYALAGATALGRLEDRKHYLSDVVFGAALGLAAGEAVEHHDRKGRLPEVSAGPGGVTVTAGF